MRRRVAAALGLCLAAGLSACDETAAGETEALVWSDDFDGPVGSLPDARKWRLEEFADATDTEKQCYTDDPANAHLDGNGYLVISALEVADNCADGWYRYLTSARLTTRDLHAWQYGRFEIRAKMPPGVGTWPSFWAIGKETGVEWPEVGEIDVMEYVGRDPRHMIGTFHGATDDGEHWFLQGSTDAAEPLSEDMHTYAVDWNQDRVVWYLDGEEYARITRAEVEKQGNWAFDRPFYLILNLAMGGVLGGDIPESTTYPQEFVVDYVRVYK